MRKRKLSVSLTDEEFEVVKKAAGERGISISRFLRELAEERLGLNQEKDSRRPA